MKRLITDLEELDTLFDRYSERFGRDQTPYRNHVYRVINLVAALRPVSGDDLRKLQIAGFYHDAGIWLAGTFDYLGPSARLACHYLQEQQRPGWAEEVRLMIAWHHKITPSGQPADSLVETFRQADWIDLSMGLIRCGLSRERLREIQFRFPNAGFHAMLANRALRYMLTRPWCPLPMLRL